MASSARQPQRDDTDILSSVRHQPADGFPDDDDDDNLSLSGIHDAIDTDWQATTPPPYNSLDLCIVCEQRPPYSKNGKSYPTCGLRCAGLLEAARNFATSNSSRTSVAGPSIDTTYRGPGSISTMATPGRAMSRKVESVPGIARSATTLKNSRSSNTLTVQNLDNLTTPTTSLDICVVCLVKPCRNNQYVTCSLSCAEELCRNGSANSNNCDYCHRKPKVPGSKQCGTSCQANAKLACLLCKCRPKFKRYHLCGKTCQSIALKTTPMILEASPGHDTFEMVERKFQAAWNNVTLSACPKVRYVYKIIESKKFLQPYDRYKSTMGNEVFRYHGTTRKCNVGNGSGEAKLCQNTQCKLCQILKTSFKTSLANPSGAFGPGIYSSSASNKAYSYTSGGQGVVLLTKVVLGKVRSVNHWNEVMSCPPGFNSVVFDRQQGTLNETVVYSDDAIRPVFLIVF